MVADKDGRYCRLYPIRRSLALTRTLPSGRDLGVLRNLCERVARATPAFRVADENALLDQRQNVTQRGAVGALGKLGVFRCRKLTLEAIKETIEHEMLALVERDTGERFPETCFGEDGAENGLRPVDGTAQTAEKPVHPGRDVQGSFLRPLKHVVIGGALLPNLCRHAVEALRAVFGARQSHIGDGTRDTIVAIIERVNGREPEMSQPRS